MFIYHFNKLIRSRLLWGFFAVIISLAFVAAGAFSGRSQGAEAAGKLNGKKISKVTFDQAVISVQGFGRNRDTEMPLQMVRRGAWEQVAAAQTAERNGLTAKEADVRDAIRREDVFIGENGFDMRRYEYILRDAGLTPVQYESLVKHDILRRKVGLLIDSATWISPMEVNDGVAAMTDRFTVQAVTMSNSFAEAEMPLTDEDYKKFYDEKKDLFRLPDRISVRYVAIPVSNYFARVTVPDDDLKDYFDGHMDEFKTTDTNSVTGFKLFEEVKDEIFAKLQREEARDCLETNAMFTIFGKRNLKAEEADALLGKLAAAEGLDVKESPLFSQGEPLPWAGNVPDLAKKAFDLEPDSMETRFDIAKGDDTVFVIELLQSSPAHIPAFDEVAEDVKKIAQDKERKDAFDNYVKMLRTDLTKRLEEGKTFEAAATEMALNVSTSLTYTVNEMQTRMFDSKQHAIASGARTLKKGELSEAVPMSASQSVLVYVINREPGDVLAAEMIASQVRTGLARNRNSTLYRDWLKWNLDRQHLEPASMFGFDESDDDE